MNDAYEYGRAERIELTAQFILGAIINAEGTCNDAHTKVNVAWDVAEIFEKERHERVSKMRNA